MPLYIVRSSTWRYSWELKSRTSDSATSCLCSSLVVRDLSSSQSNEGSRRALRGSEPATTTTARLTSVPPDGWNAARWGNVIRSDRPALNDSTTLLLPTGVRNIKLADTVVHLEAQVPTSRILDHSVSEMPHADPGSRPELIYCGTPISDLCSRLALWKRSGELSGRVAYINRLMER